MRIGERLDQTSGRPSGFDYIRIILASSVIWEHSVSTCYGFPFETEVWHSPLRPVFKLILPMFFALSGFLVAGSLERTRTLGMFLWLRAIRIYPALVVEVILSAFILGPIFTTFDYRDYFSNVEFRSYLLNITGYIHFDLPGVFANNPAQRMVNAQLWTIPFELNCYIILSVLFVFSVLKYRIVAPITAVFVTIASCAYRYKIYGAGWNVYPTLVPGIMLVVSFLLGVTIFLYRDKIIWNVKLFLICLVSAVLLYGFVRGGDLFASVFVAYLTVYLGLTSPRRLRIVTGADYSYGMYLYGYPIQQAFSALGSWTHHWYLNILVCTPVAALFAALSWHYVEKPALRLRSVWGSVHHPVPAQAGADPRG